MTKNSARVYSYLRFSDPKQATGSSADRQLQYAQQWAAARGLALDDSLSLRDEGLSAYHQMHVKQGALGVFLLAVSEGRIPDGSVLIVEGLDRLSRAEPIQAQAQLAQIINAGITVVTASDGREYNRAGLKAQPMDLVYSLLVMIRAHEESDTKSKRVSAAIRRQCEGWIAGSYRGLVRNGKDPDWLRWDGATWHLVPERVAAVREALRLYQSGIGATRVVRQLRDAGLAITNTGLGGQQIYRLIRLPALRGAKRIAVAGEDYLLEDYYPALLSDDEFQTLQGVADQRYRRRGSGEIPPIVTGMGLTYCGYCGTAVCAQNQMSRARPDGSVAAAHRRLHCVSYGTSTGCISGSCSVVPIERALMSYCSDQINLNRLLAPGDDGRELRQQLAQAGRQVDEVERQLERVTDALLADSDGAAPLAFVRKARELEAQLSDRQADVRRLEREIAGKSSVHAPAGAEVWARLAEGVEALDAGSREQVRQLVMDTFERIVVYMRGIGEPDRDAKHIDLLLVPKGGAPRGLRINRRTGAWEASTVGPQ